MRALTTPLAAAAFALAFLVHGPASTAEPLQLAQQSQQEGDYLPPWQGEEDTDGGQDDIGSRDGYAPEGLVPPSENRAREREYEPRGARRYDEAPEQYREEPRRYDERDRRYDPPPRADYDEDENFTVDEIVDAGHRFFGTVTDGLARVVEYAFSREGYPNGYILGEEAGGAFVAGLRYGEGVLYTKHLGRHKVFWQGPSIGYDFGGEGSKTMILVYDIQHPAEIYRRFAGVDGSAYFVGGVGLTFQRNGEVVLAPIRSGVGLRLGANVGYLKYTREPTWNPF